VQALTLDSEPFLEDRLAHVQPGEEIAPVQRDGALERGRCAVARERLECRDVHIDLRGVESDELTVDHKGGARRSERCPECGQALSEALARVDIS
jgi:hypothetical protein